MDDLSNCLNCSEWHCFFLRLKNVVQSLSRIQLFVTTWAATRQASLSFTISWSLLKLMSTESVMPSNNIVVCHPLSPPAFSLTQHQGLFQRVGSLHQVAKVLELQPHVGVEV